MRRVLGAIKWCLLAREPKNGTGRWLLAVVGFLSLSFAVYKWFERFEDPFAYFDVWVFTAVGLAWITLWLAETSPADRRGRLVAFRTANLLLTVIAGVGAVWACVFLTTLS